MLFASFSHELNAYWLHQSSTFFHIIESMIYRMSSFPFPSSNPSLALPSNSWPLFLYSLNNKYNEPPLNKVSSVYKISGLATWNWIITLCVLSWERWCLPFAVCLVVQVQRSLSKIEACWAIPSHVSLLMPVILVQII